MCGRFYVQRYRGAALFQSIYDNQPVPVLNSVRWLLQRKFPDLDQHVYIQNSLVHASLHRQLEVLRWLHEECGASLRVRDDGLLRRAIKDQNVDIVRYILRQLTRAPIITSATLLPGDFSGRRMGSATTHDDEEEDGIRGRSSGSSIGSGDGAGSSSSSSSSSSHGGFGDESLVGSFGSLSSLGAGSSMGVVGVGNGVGGATNEYAEYYSQRRRSLEQRHQPPQPQYQHQQPLPPWSMSQYYTNLASMVEAGSSLSGPLPRVSSSLLSLPQSSSTPRASRLIPMTTMAGTPRLAGSHSQPHSQSHRSQSHTNPDPDQEDCRAHPFPPTFLTLAIQTENEAILESLLESGCVKVDDWHIRRAKSLVASQRRAQIIDLLRTHRRYQKYNRRALRARRLLP